MMQIDIPVLRTHRLVMRGFRAADLDRFALITADAAVMRFVGSGHAYGRPDSWTVMAASLGQWGLRGYGRFAVADGDDQVIGCAGLLHPIHWPEPELAFLLARPCWAQGLATEAVTAIRDWAFATHGFAHLASFIAPANAAAQRVAAKLGAVREGMIDLGGPPAERWVYYHPGSGPVA